MSFKVWKDEAFALWREQWAKLYPEGSASRELLHHISDTYYLVNLVDNDYPKESCLWDLLNTMFAQRELDRQSDFIQHDLDEMDKLTDKMMRQISPDANSYTRYTMEDIVEAANRQEVSDEITASSEQTQ